MEEYRKYNNGFIASLSLKEKLFQMFVLGFHGTEPSEQNLNVQNAIKSGLGGVILFSENITSYEQTAGLTAELKKLGGIPLFVSIDQEGGRVERTINVKDKVNYLSPLALAQTGEPENAGRQAEKMVDELKSIGVNMNFAPVLDVNTNPNNPIIGVRSFGADPDTVIRFSRPVYETFLKNNIIPVVKHFPGHGDTGEDSHCTMPQVDLSLEDLEKHHIEPFKTAFNEGVEAVMVAHAHYSAFDSEQTPASLSGNVIKGYLRGKLGFNGLVISDDMVMGGVKNYYDSVEACVRGIKAGIDLFVFRNSDDGTINIINSLADCVESGVLSSETIDNSVRRILNCKLKNLYV